MPNRWPQLPQTTVSISTALEAVSEGPRRRRATPFGFTSAALDVDGDCGRCVARRRRRGIHRYAGLVALLR